MTGLRRVAAWVSGALSSACVLAALGLCVFGPGAPALVVAAVAVPPGAVTVVLTGPHEGGGRRG